MRLDPATFIVTLLLACLVEMLVDIVLVHVVGWRQRR